MKQASPSRTSCGDTEIRGLCIINRGEEHLPTPPPLPTMLEPAFEALGPMLGSEDPASSLDYLIRQFREAKDYHLLFEAKLMKKRLELGLPLIQAPNLGSLPRDVQAEYQQYLVEVAQETGELFLLSGNIPKAWPYLRATGDVQRVAAAIENVEPGESVDAIIEIAFMQGVHPAKGLELVIEKFGICRALTYFGGNGGEKDREQCIGVLARSIYSELVASIDNAIEEREGHRSGLTSIAGLIEGRDWLFGEYSSYIDPSHLVSLLQYSPEVTDAATLRQFHEICEYGKRLSANFQFPGRPPFEDPFVDYDHYVQALLGVDVDRHIAHFRKKLGDTETAGNWTAQILVTLLVRLERYREALEISLEHLPGAHASEIACPTAQQLCELAGDFNRLAELARERGDVLTYVAAHLEAAAPAAAAKRR